MKCHGWGCLAEQPAGCNVGDATLRKLSLREREARLRTQGGCWVQPEKDPCPRRESAATCGASPGKRAWGRRGEEDLSQHRVGEGRPGRPGAPEGGEGAVSPWTGNETGPARPARTSWPRDDAGHRLLSQDYGPLSMCQDWDGGKVKSWLSAPRANSFWGWDGDMAGRQEEKLSPGELRGRAERGTRRESTHKVWRR